MKLENILLRLEKLEVHQAFQENIIEKLNQSIVMLQLESIKQQELIRLLSNKLVSMHHSNIALPEEESPPPHY